MNSGYELPAMSRNMTRIISSIVSLPILFAIIYFGTPFHFFILLEIIIFIALYEFYRMIERAESGCYKWTGIIFGILLPIGIFKEVYSYTNLFVASAIITSFILRIFEGNKYGNTYLYIPNTLFGILYISLLMSYILMVRMIGYQGRELVFFVLMATWMGDTAAYFGGKGFGKHQLAPLISPKKTIEGAVAGLIGSISGALIAKLWFLDINFSNAIIAGILIGIFGQLGDLSESLIKRNLHVKDSGSIIPGHGGMLDRIDSLLFSLPVFYYYYIYIVSG